MRYQSMLGRQDRFSGNILLYDYLSRKRAPVFLDRNLTQILEAHEDLMNRRNTRNHRNSDFHFRSQWKPPSDDQLSNMMVKENGKGSFVLEVHAIAQQSSRQAAQKVDHDPTNKARTLLRVSSTIRMTVIPSSYDDPPTKSFARDAMLRGIDRGSDRKASVEMSSVVLKPKDICVDPHKLTRDDSYSIIVSVNFASHADVGELYSYLGLKSSDTATYLSTSYGNILECPQGKITLPLKADGKPIKIGLEVSMYWNTTTGDSILAQHNRHLRSTLESPSSYPTPPRDPLPRYKLAYIYGKETLERSNLQCVHCIRVKHHKDISALQMHLDAWHDIFAYQVIPKGLDEDGVEHWRFVSEVADSKGNLVGRASDRADGPRDARVLAPGRPFDRRRFLEGDNGWQHAAKVGKHVKPQKGKQTVDISAPLLRHQKPPDEVQERARREKKMFIVPKAPHGITFFRSFSKRPLQPGEEISESDDELDEDWMHLRKYAEIDRIGLPAPASRFLKVFDDFMHDENLHADIHAGDAIIRFARRNGARIWQDDIMTEFTKKLDELLEDDLISKEVHAGAIQLVHDQKMSPLESNELSQRLAELDVQHQADRGLAGHKTRRGPMSKRDGKGKGKAVVTETGHLTPITADSDGDVDMREVSLNVPADLQGAPQDENLDPPYDECYCGEDASATPGPSGFVACSNIVSPEL
ncbi:polycomb protein vefs-box [Stemphylium lycopersici]|nr:polycomb protein vefs-box [Stemphylium lycopersici]